MITHRDRSLEETGSHQQEGADEAAATPGLLADVQLANLSGGEPLPRHLAASLGARLGTDLSGVRLHTGGASADAAEALDARAFTVGKDIHFAAGEAPGSAPGGMRLLTHEIAHVAQNTSAPAIARKARVDAGDGDAAEREADDVAHALMAGGREPVRVREAPSAVVHRDRKKKGRPSKVKEAKPKIEADLDAAKMVAWVLARLLDGKETPKIALQMAPAKYAAALTELKDALAGIGPGGAKLDPIAKCDQFETALRKLQPAMNALFVDEEGALILDVDVMPPLTQRRESLQSSKANARIEKGDLAGAATAKLPSVDDSLPLEDQKQTVAATVTKLVGTADKIAAIADKVLARKDLTPAQHDELLKSLGGKGELAVGAMAEALSFASTFLSLTGDEFAKKVSKLHESSFFGKVATVTELIKGILELSQSLVGALTKTAGLIASLTGNTQLAARLAGVSEGMMGTVGKLASIVSIVHGISVLLDSDASDQDKIDAGVGVTTGILSLAGAGPAGTAIAGTYLMVKYFADMYWGVVTGMVGGGMKLAFQAMSDRASSLVTASTKLAVAGILHESETDPDQKVPLGNALRAKAASVGESIDDFIVDTRHAVWGESWSKPAFYAVLREAFAPLAKWKGKREPSDVAEAAAAVIERIVWCLEHAATLTRAEMTQTGLEDALEWEAEQGDDH